MSFVSPLFLCAFLPATLILCLVVRRVAWQNALLTVLSLAFYAFGEPRYILVLLSSVAIDYGCGLWAARAVKKAWPTGIGIAIHLGMLCLFKYAGFFTQTVNSVLGVSLPVSQLALPIGISFFTFQGVSYLCDVARGECAAQRDPIKLTLYISFFPQLIAGPIVRYQSISEQLAKRSMTSEGMARGLRRLIVGLAKKVLVADTIGRIADAAFTVDPAGLGASLAWLGAIAFMLQIYLDFSGYTDMALGMGEMLGFHLPENFNEPYRAASMTDFWRRWHITLTGWFRSYVYIPLGGNRRGTAKTCCNLMLVFALTGLWHGASWTFVIWGLLNGALIVLERLNVIKPSAMPRPLRHGYTLLCVLIGFVIFRVDTLTGATGYLGAMLGQAGFNAAQALRCLPPIRILCLLAALLLSLGTFKGFFTPKDCFARAAIDLMYIALLALCCLSVISSSYHPFLYFRF